MYDVVTIGEGMLRLSPPPFERIRRASTLDLHVCGSQGNVACTARQFRGPRHGSFGATVLCDGNLYEGKAHEIEIVDRFGTGDAWDSGFFYGCLARSDPQYAVDFANALCALAHTMPGDVAHATVAEVEALMGSGQLDVRR